MKKELYLSFILCVIIIISLFFLAGCPRIDVIEAFLYDGDDTDSPYDSLTEKTDVRGSGTIIIEVSE